MSLGVQRQLPAPLLFPRYCCIFFFPLPSALPDGAHLSHPCDALAAMSGWRSRSGRCRPHASLVFPPGWCLHPKIHPLGVFAGWWLKTEQSPGIQPHRNCSESSGSITGPAARAAGRALSLACGCWSRSSCLVHFQMF